MQRIAVQECRCDVAEMTPVIIHDTDMLLDKTVDVRCGKIINNRKLELRAHMYGN